MINLVEKKSCRRILLLSSTGAMGAHGATVDDRLAEGNIRTYEVALVVFNAVNVILSCLALKYGFVPESVYVISIVVEISIMWSRIRMLGKVYKLYVKEYYIKVVGKIALISVVTGIFTYWISLPIEKLLVRFIAVSIIVVLFTAVVIYLIGLGNN